ncbi:hypothetical protein VTL71DRAFT_2228 [Oculimacula yallundae]|uniref:Uncharacterized protein n=1 Tax=Oculimacula yallundae TaxID=86028 RepID=A0ABR4C8A4_9HELO
MSNNNGLGKVKYTRTSDELLSGARNHNQKSKTSGHTYSFSYEQYRAAFPSAEQQRAGLSWDDVIEENLSQYRTDQTASFGSSNYDVDYPKMSPPTSFITARTASTASATSAANTTDTAVNGGSAREQSPDPTALLRELLAGSTPLPRTHYHNSNRRLTPALKPIGFERGHNTTS